MHVTKIFSNHLFIFPFSSKTNSTNVNSPHRNRSGLKWTGDKPTHTKESLRRVLPLMKGVEFKSGRVPHMGDLVKHYIYLRENPIDKLTRKASLAREAAKILLPFCRSQDASEKIVRNVTRKLEIRIKRLQTLKRKDITSRDILIFFKNLEKERIIFDDNIDVDMDASQTDVANAIDDVVMNAAYDTDPHDVNMDASQNVWLGKVGDEGSNTTHDAAMNDTGTVHHNKPSRKHKLYGEFNLKLPTTVHGHNLIPVTRTAIVSLRFDVEPIKAAAIASAAHEDYGVVSKDDKRFVVDRNKIVRERKKLINSFSENFKIPLLMNAVYFDSKENYLTSYEKSESTGKTKPIKKKYDQFVMVGRPGSAFIGVYDCEIGQAAQMAYGMREVIWKRGGY